MSVFVLGLNVFLLIQVTMSEVNLKVMMEADKVKTEAKVPDTHMQEINDALEACTFGWFHLRLLVTSFFGLTSGVFVTNTTPYILPNAECDLNMNLFQKGLLNAMPFIGMILTSVLAGFLTDTFGRKKFLVGGFAGIALFNLLSSLSQTYEMLLVAKFFEGFLFGSTFGSTVSFTSEYCHHGIRDRVMLLQSSFASTGQIVLAGIAWGVLTQDWKTSLFGGAIVLNSWNFLLLIMSAWTLLACILYCFLPESPKYLLTQKKHEEARQILLNIYKQNTGKPVSMFPYPYLFKNMARSQKDMSVDHPGAKKMGFRHMLVTGLHNVKPIFQKPLGPYLFLFCLFLFLVMILFNIIRLWFPQLSTIVEHYDHLDGDLCVKLDTYTKDLRSRSFSNSTEPQICVPVKSGTETYINSVILGAVGLCMYLISGVIVNKVGKRALEIVAGLIATGCTLGLRWASTKTQVVALFATSMGVGQGMMSIMQTMTVEYFPTTTRAFALGVTMMCGRIGSLTGNVTFPILLDMGCAIPFFTLAGIMICVTCISFLLPEKKNRATTGLAQSRNPP